MAQILVRNLDEDVVQKLKERAKREGRSLQAEVRRILREAASVQQVDMATARELVEKVRRLFGDRKFPDSAELIREDRDR